MAASKLSKLFRSAAYANFAFKTSPTTYSILKESTRRFSWGPKAMFDGVANLDSIAAPDIDSDGDRCWAFKNAKSLDQRLDQIVKLCAQKMEAGNMGDEVLLLLGTIFADVSSASLASIFKSLGRLSLESFAMKLVVHLQTNGSGAEDVSNFIYNYASSMSNSSVEDIALAFKNLHEKFAVNPSRVTYEKLIRFSCDSHKVHLALDIVDWMLKAGLTTSIETFHSMLNAIWGSCEYDLVYYIYSAIYSHNLEPNDETFRIMLTLCVESKDFDGAYEMIKDMAVVGIAPDTQIFYAVMRGREFFPLDNEDNEDDNPYLKKSSWIFDLDNYNSVEFHEQLSFMKSSRNDTASN